MLLPVAIAGTYKALIQKALANLFYEIGLHLFCLAPFNSNVDNFTNRVAAGLPEVGLKRLYTARYEFGRRRSSKQAPEKNTEQPIKFDILLDRVNRKMNLKAEPRQHGIQAAVLEIAV